MKTLFIVLLCFLSITVTAQACPTITYERYLLENWHIKYSIVTLLVPVLVASNRLDVVRTLLAFIPYTLFSLWIHSILFWHVNPWFRPDWMPGWVADLAWFFWGMNLIGAGILIVLSRIACFRWKKDKGLALWQLVLYPFIGHVTIAMLR